MMVLAYQHSSHLLLISIQTIFFWHSHELFYTTAFLKKKKKIWYMIHSMLTKVPVWLSMSVYVYVTVACNLLCLHFNRSTWTRAFSLYLIAFSIYPAYMECITVTCKPKRSKNMLHVRTWRQKVGMGREWEETCVYWFLYKMTFFYRNGVRGLQTIIILMAFPNYWKIGP